ncbi:pyridoxal-phosphate dependent enzyme [Streptomyces sp. NPDC004284]|uniref:pyridoxal-phosphate dependent enzyme n=1 Tax=Streptomyces sp. NPDC004284 TaxID=3364695 RepID=UPI0036B3ADDA
MQTLAYADVRTAADRIGGRIRPVTVTPADPGDEPYTLHLALELMQHTGSFKARGAQNFSSPTGRRAPSRPPESPSPPAATPACACACAWAARRQGVRAAVFLPTTAPRVEVDKLRGHDADVRLVGTEYAEALAACEAFAADSGALASHAYDHLLIAAGAGTLLDEIHRRIPDLDAALRAGHPVDVTVDSVAADFLGARRTSALAVNTARHQDVHSVLVTDADIVRARRTLWDDRRLAVEHAATTPTDGRPATGCRPAPGEKICVVLCGADTDPTDLTRPPAK